MLPQPRPKADPRLLTPQQKNAREGLVGAFVVSVTVALKQASFLERFNVP